ncbi:hypothetical protein N9L68_00985, partial [bacterium]|nr:hypothetical protein [bacterium]
KKIDPRAPQKRFRGAGKYLKSNPDKFEYWSMRNRTTPCRVMSPNQFVKYNHTPRVEQKRKLPGELPGVARDAPAVRGNTTRCNEFEVALHFTNKGK